jgi:hypothetical protein
VDCERECAAAGEPLAGSAGAVAAWVGIRWPKPLWDADEALGSQGLPQELGTLAEAHAQGGAKLAFRVFQRAARPSTERVELLLWRPGGPRGARSDLPLAELVPLVTRFLLAGEQLDLEPLAPQLLVCTDGKHDRCCARLGRPLYEALQAQLGAGPGALRLAECSHLGGHRFAANCLSLPDGRLYGRVALADGAALLAAVREGRPYYPRLRGALARDPSEENAAAFLDQHCGALAWQIEGPAQRAGEELRVPARIGGDAQQRRVFVRLVRRVYTAATSCDADAVDTARWVATSIEPA